MPVRLLHLVGSAVSEFHGDLSRLYAADCLASIEDPALYESFIAYVSPDGTWRFPDDLTRDAIGSARPVSLAVAVLRLGELRPDVMVPQMFCVPGMTSYRGLFDLLDIPYLGNTPDVMALTSNKVRTKAVVGAAGVRVPRGEVLRNGEWPCIEPPAVVKPVASDNSVGLALARGRGDYKAALASAFAHSEEVLVETYVELGREVRCGVIVRDGQLISLPLEEYRMDQVRKPVRDQDDKLGRTADGDLTLVAKDETRAWIVDPADPLTEKVGELAKRCHVALGCRHYSLFDFRVDPEGEPWFLEAGPYCSFARKSVISMMAKASGIDVEELFDIVLREATTT
jgi:D-alanine-D-alanine ligase